MMMDRRHGEDAPTQEVAAEDLDNDGRELQIKNKAEKRQEEHPIDDDHVDGEERAEAE